MVSIGNISYSYYKDIRNNNSLRQSFFTLANNTFGIDFEAWYTDGHWSEKYIPHVLAHNNQVVANASVNIIDVVHKGKKTFLVQIGTVMTHPDYRNSGLSSYLIKSIINEYAGQLIYLYANDSVVDFYPKLGFIKSLEYQYSLKPSPAFKAVPLNMDDPLQAQLLLKLYALGNPYSALFSTKNPGLLMFYCCSFLKDCVYYSKELNAAAIVVSNGADCTIYDILGGSTADLNTAINTFTPFNATSLHLGFTPLNPHGMTVLPINEDDSTLFVHKSYPSPFDANKLMLPLLSHA